MVLHSLTQEALGRKWAQCQSFFHCQASQASVGVGWLSVIPGVQRKEGKGNQCPPVYSKALGGHEAIHHMHG